MNSEHPITLKNSILYSQILRLKSTCSTIENLKLHCSELKQKFIKTGYKSDLLDKCISTVEKLNRDETLKEKVREKPKQIFTPLALTTTYSPICLSNSKVKRKY